MNQKFSIEKFKRLSIDLTHNNLRNVDLQNIYFFSQQKQSIY